MAEDTHHANTASIHGLCVGCGVCAGVCPCSCLDMRDNGHGEYAPVDTGGCIGCGLCLRACPFGEGNENEDELSRELYGGSIGIGCRSDCGYYARSFLGYSAIGEHRSNAASGGLATWTLEKLLAGGLVDKVIAVRPNPDPGKLFEFALLDSVESVRGCAKSCYYPVEISGVLRQVLEEDARYAVVGLPCYVKALRLAERRNPLLRTRIRFHLGLVCAGLKSKFFASYLVRMGGGDPGAVRQVSFRDKVPGRTAREALFAFRADPASPEPDGGVFWTHECGCAGRNWFFQIDACNYCDDVFAETADIVFMDAWLPEYQSDWRGTSIAIARTPEMARLLEAGRVSGELAITEIPIGLATQSQAPVISAKREGLALRLAVAERLGRPSPRKRVRPEPKPSLRSVLNQRMAFHLQAASRDAWIMHADKGIDAFHRALPVYQLLLASHRLRGLYGRVRGGTASRLSILGRRLRSAGKKVVR